MELTWIAVVLQTFSVDYLINKEMNKALRIVWTVQSRQIQNRMKFDPNWKRLVRESAGSMVLGMQIQTSLFGRCPGT